MNTIHNNGENDRNLNKDLDELGQTYSKLEQDEPPELLDQAILNRARRAVEQKPHWMQFGWLHGLTTTAVVVLAFTIYLNQPRMNPAFKNDILSNTPSTLPSDAELKKQTVNRSNNFRQKAAVDAAPAVSAPATPSVEMSELREEIQPPPVAESRVTTHDAARGKREQDDKNTVSMDDAQEETLMDEADAVAGALAADTAARQVSAPARTAPVNSEMESRERTDLTAQLELETIIELKNAGNESWVKRLKAFVERYPDYELPDELKD